MASLVGDSDHDPNDDSSVHKLDDVWRDTGPQDHAKKSKMVVDKAPENDPVIDVTDSKDDAERRKKSKRGVFNSHYATDLDKMHVEKTDEQISKLRELKSNDESDFCNKITELLNDDNKKNNFLKNEKFHKLVEEYLLPTDSYRGIGVQFEEKDPNYPKKSEFRIHKVFNNSFASKIGLEEGDVIVLDEQSNMNIFDLVTNLRKGKLNPVKEIVRDGKVILNKQELTDNFDNSIDVTTEIDCKSDTGKFDSKINKKFSKEQKEGIDKIKKIVRNNRVLPNLYDSHQNPTLDPQEPKAQALTFEKFCSK